MPIGDTIILILNFLSYPTWHLVVLYVFLFLLVAWAMIKSFGF